MKLIFASSITLVVSALLVGCSGAPNDPAGTEGSDLSTAAATTKAPTPSSAATVVRDPICPVDEKICRVEKADGECGVVCVKDFVLCVAPVKCEPSATGGDPTTITDPNDGGASTTSTDPNGGSTTQTGGGGSASGSGTSTAPSTGGGSASGGGTSTAPASGGTSAAGGSGDPGPSAGVGHPICDPIGGPHPGCKWDEKACVWLCA